MAVAQTCRAKLAQLFCFGMVRAGEHAACGHRRRPGNGVPYSRKRRSREDQENREAPEGYDFTRLLTMGYPAENAFLPKHKEINAADRILFLFPSIYNFGQTRQNLRSWGRSVFNFLLYL